MTLLLPIGDNPRSDNVEVRYLHEKDGNAGKVSNSAKPSIMDAFLSFTDGNSQPSGGCADSHGPTHYFIPKF